MQGKIPLLVLVKFRWIGEPVENFFVIFNHELSPEQIAEISGLGYKHIYRLPEDLQQSIANIMAKGDFPLQTAERIIQWITGISQKQDGVLIQTEYGITYYLINRCFEMGLIPYYSTTMRDYQFIHQPDGSTKNIHVFKHVQFRKYIP